ncbi:MAG: hypothetical protein LBS99_00625, partial [Clostridiales bacterium]|nr:hypothetical protein [Clostridiales bacterium]
YTVTSALNRLLAVHSTRRAGIQPQKYALDPVVAARYANVEAPEFYMTKSTLWEALAQVGGYIHAIPRLLPDNVITFDPLGGDDEIKIKGRLTARDGYQSDEQFCAEIDAQVDNLINTTDTQQGSVTDPCYNAFKTVRCEDGNVEISDTTCVISTEYPIYNIIKLEMGYAPDGVLVGDITPFVYEAAEYGALSGYDDAYPYSKAYALKYTQGDNKITALTFKLTDAIGPAIKNPVLQNIVDKIRGAEHLNTHYKNLAFRVTYIPIIAGRIKQRKTMPDGFKGALIYNQSANSVEAEAYGESLKGVIAKLGNPVETRTYMLDDLDDIPQCGQLVDGKYIASIDLEYQKEFIKATVTLTADYNRLADYIGINSAVRFFDVSEKQSVDRFVNYGEALLIGDPVPAGNVMMSAFAAQAFADVFTQSGYAGGAHIAASHAVTAGKNSDGAPVSPKIIHSVVSFAAGNSLVFSWKNQDNYSAGVKAAKFDDHKNTQQYVPYGDDYGELDALDMNIGYFLNPTVKGYTPDLNALENTYPQFAADAPQIAYFNTGDNPFIIKKDSRENIIFTYQLHMQQTRKSIVIGTALMQNNPLVRGTDANQAARFVWLPNRLNKFEKTPDLAGAVEVPRSNYIHASGSTFYIDGFVNAAERTFRSWAFVDADGYLLIGENGDIVPGESTKQINFTPVNIKD